MKKGDLVYLYILNEEGKIEITKGIVSETENIKYDYLEYHKNIDDLINNLKINREYVSIIQVIEGECEDGIICYSLDPDLVNAKKNCVFSSYEEAKNTLKNMINDL